MTVEEKKPTKQQRGGKKKNQSNYWNEKLFCSQGHQVLGILLELSSRGKKKKEKRHNLDEMLMRGEGKVEGKDRNKPNSHLMTSLSIILNPFTVPRCENRISPDRKDLMAVSGLRARDHHFLPRQISSATCPHKALSKRIKASSIKSGLKKIHGKYSWHSFYPPPQWKKEKKTKNCRTDDVAILRSFVNCQPGLTLQKTNREHGGSVRLHGEEEGKKECCCFY